MDNSGEVTPEFFQQDIHQLQNALLSWFELNKRDFPWRKNREPFAILVAEKLLQQTSVRDPVVHAYQILLETYPTPAALASADIAHITNLIAPLGFHFRARELIVLARAITDDFDGEVPRTLEKLKSLPGVGEYAARAVLSFAYGDDVAVVDTNVARFLHRVFALTKPISANPARDKKMIALASNLLPPGKSRDFNLAILDLCAQICRPRRPICEVCPINSLCAYGRRTLTE